MPNCTNCHTEVSQKYCGNCGQGVALKRIDGHYIAHEIEHVLHFERGILYTVKELLIAPGKTVRHFIDEDRSRLVKPIIFIIITSLIYSVVNHFFHIEEGYMQFKEEHKSTTGYIFNWVQNHYGYGNIIMGVFIALWIKIFFRKHNYNCFEILILLCFIIGMGMLIFTVFAIAQGISHIKLMQYGGCLGIIYCTWGIGQFFNKRKIGNYVKAFFAYAFGMITFMLVALALGTTIDMFIKH